MATTLDSPPIHLPQRGAGPIVGLARRVGAALSLVVFVAMLAYVDRDEYKDAAGNAVNLVDCFYYATVSITTTGYGDIIPVTDKTRLITTLLITPARILFLIILVSTTLEVLAERTRTAYRERAWRKRLRSHTIVCGFGTKGRAAIRTLQARGVPDDSIVVVDLHDGPIEAAGRAGLAVVQGDAALAEVLEAAGIREAESIVIAPSRDDAAVLMTLTARELNAEATIVASVREEENAHLLRQSGATSVIVSSAAAGRLLGNATHSPHVIQVLEDLIGVGEGLDIVEREVSAEKVGRTLREVEDGAPVLAVVRDGQILHFDDERAATVQAGDRVVCLCSN